jgi:hypothetical protein
MYKSQKERMNDSQDEAIIVYKRDEMEDLVESMLGEVKNMFHPVRQLSFKIIFQILSTANRSDTDRNVSTPSIDFGFSRK